MTTPRKIITDPSPGTIPATPPAKIEDATVIAGRVDPKIVPRPNYNVSVNAPCDLFLDGWIHARVGSARMRFRLPENTIDAQVDVTVQNPEDAFNIALSYKVYTDNPYHPYVEISWINTIDYAIPLDYKITPLVPEGEMQVTAPASGVEYNASLTVTGGMSYEVPMPDFGTHG